MVCGRPLWVSWMVPGSGLRWGSQRNQAKLIPDGVPCLAVGTTVGHMESGDSQERFLLEMGSLLG